MKKLPISRNGELVVQKTDCETLLYDLKSHKAFCLNETSSLIWEHCDGKTDVKDFAVENELNEEIIELALDKFQQNNLLKEKIESKIPIDRIERRKFMLKVGGMAAVGLPIVSKIVAPSAVFAQSCAGPGPVPPGNLPPATPQPDAIACSTYCRSVCCNGAASSSVTIPAPGSLCTCNSVVCN